jgi:hypothetical protein
MRSAHPTRIDAAAVSEDAFVFAYPLVLMELMRIALTSVDECDPLTMRAPPNRLVHSRSRGRGGVIAGTLNSSAWFDLAAAPVVLSVPETHGRYYCMSLIDMWTNGFASVGPRTTGTAAGAYAIGLGTTDPGDLPPDVLPITAPTRYVRLVGETCIERGEPEATARAIERGYTLTPLAGRPSSAADSPVAPRREPLGGSAPAERVDRMTARTFFAFALRLLADNPPRIEDRRVMARAQQIGLFAAGAAAWTAAEPSLRERVEHGVERAREAIRARAAAVIDEASGRWHIDYGAGEFSTDYVSRASAARVPLGKGLAADALPALTHADAAGQPLDGRHRYVLRFDRDAPPPVHGFWSLSTHVRPEEAIATPAWSTTLGDRDGLTVDSDGSLRIHIQRDRPPRQNRSNWLPTPAGAFALILRLHWPREELVAGRWTPPAVARAD